MAQKRSLLLGAGAASLLTFLFVQQKPIDSEQHDRVMLALRLLERLDAEVNADLLGSRYDLLRSYDPFVQKLLADVKLAVTEGGRSVSGRRTRD